MASLRLALARSITIRAMASKSFPTVSDPKTTTSSLLLMALTTNTTVTRAQPTASSTLTAPPFVMVLALVSRVAMVLTLT